MTNKESNKDTRAETDTMTVRLEDGTEAQRPYFIQRPIGSSDQPAQVRVPIAYPGEEALPIPAGGWLIRRLRK